MTKPAAYKVLRVVMGAVVLSAALLAFLDVGDWVGARFTDVALGLQFVPALVAATEGVGTALGVVVFVVLLTLLFGRVYCAMLCPLGVCMDAAAWIAGRSGKNRRLPYRRGLTWLRAGVLAVLLATLALGTLAGLGFLDPYSLFGRMTAGTLRPALGWLLNRLALAGVGKALTISPVSWTVLGIGSGLLAVVLGMAVWRGRLWCNTLCPVGTTLGFLSRFSLFRLRISNTECVGCSLCERVCPAQCIDYRARTIDPSRCVMCLDCVTHCRKTGIHLLPVWERGDQESRAAETAGTPAPEPARVAMVTGRRAVLGLIGAGVLERATARAEEDEEEEKEHGKGKGWRGGRGEGKGRGEHGNGQGHRGEGAEEHGGLTQSRKTAVLPPGAVSHAHFQAHCTACHLCVVQCPEQVLRPAITQHGLAGFLQPFMDFEVSFCSYECSNCGDICPTGAIRPLALPARKVAQQGIAMFFRDRCVVHRDHTSCGACSEHCPTQAVHMVPFGKDLSIPKVDPELCIGCGGCEFICPARPHKAIVVEGLAVPGVAKMLEKGTANTVRKMEEEFPF